MPKRRKNKGNDGLVRLGYTRAEGLVCGACLEPLTPGMLVGWRKVPAGKGMRPDVLCTPCYRAHRSGRLSWRAASKYLGGTSTQDA
jgi:hypothetical protein